MQVSLRHAHKLVDKINARLATIDLTAAPKVNYWETEASVELFVELRNVFANTLNRQLGLVRARQQLRDGIQAANAEAVNSLIAERKLVLDLIGTYRHVLATVDATALGTPEALGLTLTALRTAAAAGHRGYGGDTVTVSVLSAKDVESLDDEVSRLQLQLEHIEDRLTAANHKEAAGVVLSDTTVTVLTQEKVI